MMTDTLLATLVSADEGLEMAGLLPELASALQQCGASPCAHALEAPGCARLTVSGVTQEVARAALEAALGDRQVDVVIRPAGFACRLFVADMDSTMIGVECIDELADFIGRKAEVAAVTEAAMRGELDFIEALTSRVALFKGMPEADLERCYDERVRPNLTPGGRALVAALNAAGATTVLVSGGFSVFVEKVAAELGFGAWLANVLEVSDGRLTGRVTPPIVTADIKRQALLDIAARSGLAPSDCVALGDGANDIPMIEAAGLGVAYHAKPRTLAAADAAVRYGDLSVLHRALL